MLCTTTTYDMICHLIIDKTIDYRIEDWSAFQDMFESVVHENEVLAKVQKFHYLKISLSIR